MENKRAKPLHHCKVVLHKENGVFKLDLNGDGNPGAERERERERDRETERVKK
jgi:hypothetical protein